MNASNEWINEMLISIVAIIIEGMAAPADKVMLIK